MEKETDTPETDAVSDYWLEPGMAGEYEIVKADFARKLERERDRLEVNGIHSCHHECQRPICKLRRERDALLAGMREIVACAHNSMDALDEAEKMETIAKSFLENDQVKTRRDEL
jgi:hypothetical protein